MFKGHDLSILGEVHDENRRISSLLFKIEVCKTDLKARHMRIKARRQMSEARLTMRQLREYITKREKDGRNKAYKKEIRKNEKSI